MELQWKDHKGYLISNNGDVKRKDKLLQCSIMNRGYRYFQTQIDGVRCNYLIHHLVAELFIGPRPENLVIDHIDQNKLNNNVNNLRYITQKANCFNQKRVKQHIPQDDPERQYKLSQEYYIENKSKILKRIMCECGKIYTEKHKNRHFKSDRHLNFIKDKDNVQDTEKLCECGVVYEKKHWRSHLRLNRHNKYLEELESLNED